MQISWVSSSVRRVISHTELIDFRGDDPLLGFGNDGAGSAFGSSSRMLDN